MEYRPLQTSPIKRPELCDLSVIWRDKRDDTGYSFSPTKSAFSVKKPPFGLDFEPVEIPDEEVKTGYKKGGPKEARLFRVALLSSKKEVDHLHPIKVTNIHPDAKEELLAEDFSRYGAIGDVYIPRNLATGKAREFAIVRFEKEEAARRALANRTMRLQGAPPKREVGLDRLPKQYSVFTNNSGVNGITNDISDEMRHTEFLKMTRKLEFKQDITLAECFSRSGYPWGSKQELRILEPHAPKEVMAMYTIKLENINKTTSIETLQQVFGRYGQSLADVYCPKSLNVYERSMNHNDGIGYIRYGDARDYRAALKDVAKKLIVIDDHLIEGESITAYSWPTDKTRRYW